MILTRNIYKANRFYGINYALICIMSLTPTTKEELYSIQFIISLCIYISPLNNNNNHSHHNHHNIICMRLSNISVGEWCYKTIQSALQQNKLHRENKVKSENIKHKMCTPLPYKQATTNSGEWGLINKSSQSTQQCLHSRQGSRNIIRNHIRLKHFLHLHFLYFCFNMF